MLGTECVRCFCAPSDLTASKALRSANRNCEIKAPDVNLQLLPPHHLKFNVELASVCQRSALRGTDRPSNPSEKSTLSFGGRGLLFCRTRSRQIPLYILFCTHVALSVRWVWKSHVDKSRNTVVGHLRSNIYKDFHDDIYRRFVPVAAQSPLMHAYCIATFPISWM